MPSYVPNATQTTEPVESRTVESAALEFRTLKTRVNDLEDAVEAEDVKDLRVPEASIAAVPDVATRAGKVLGFNASGDPIAIAVSGVDDPSLRADLAASGGAGLVGYLPAGTGAVATTVQSKLRESVSMKDFGAVGDGSDETIKVQAVLNSGAKRVVVPAGRVFGVTGLVLADGQTLEILGTIKKLSGGSPIIVMGNSSKVIGTGEIDGNSVTCDGVFMAEKTDVEISGLYIHHVGGKGIATYTSGADVVIHSNRLANVGQQAISLEYVAGAAITNNRVDTALHGIQWWGGDSNTSNVPGTFAIKVVGNNVTNVMGGIWGSLGQNITVTGNHVENCSDVGIDFEGCFDFTCTGNTAYECENGCYSVFYGAQRGVFSNNSARNVISNGSGFYATTNGVYKNERLVISGNTFSTKGTCIYADQNANRSLSTSVISGNHLLSTGGSSAITILQNEKLQIHGNNVTTVGSKIGIQLQAVSHSSIRDNDIAGFNDPSTAPGAAGGIWLYQQSASLSSQFNTVRGNRIDSFAYSITDECPSDVTKSNNDIQHNSLTNVYRTAGAGYTGVVANNYYIYSPAMTIPATIF